MLYILKIIKNNTKYLFNIINYYFSLNFKKVFIKFRGIISSIYKFYSLLHIRVTKYITIYEFIKLLLVFILLIIFYNYPYLLKLIIEYFLKLTPNSIDNIKNSLKFNLNLSLAILIYFFKGVINKLINF